jgi:hypothetical protein
MLLPLFELYVIIFIYFSVVPWRMLLPLFELYIIIFIYFSIVPWRMLRPLFELYVIIIFYFSELLFASSVGWQPLLCRLASSRVSRGVSGMKLNYYLVVIQHSS